MPRPGESVGIVHEEVIYQTECPYSHDEPATYCTKCGWSRAAEIALRVAAADAIDNLADHVGSEFFKDAGQVATLDEVRQWLRSCAAEYRKGGEQ